MRDHDFMPHGHGHRHGEVPGGHMQVGMADSAGEHVEDGLVGATVGIDHWVGHIDHFQRGTGRCQDNGAHRAYFLRYFPLRGLF